MTPPTKITVLISGSGTNLQALIDKLPTTIPSSSIIRVISNRKAAFGLKRAENAKIPTAYHNLLSYKKRYPDDETKAREEYDRDLAEMILKDGPDVVVCAGFMHILSVEFLVPLEEKAVTIINLHPGMFSWLFVFYFFAASIFYLLVTFHIFTSSLPHLFTSLSTR
jgi:phosphoribosylglycinamide formyltransferase